MATVRNGIPLVAIYFESIIFIFTLGFSILTLYRYLQRRKMTTYFLFMTNISLTIGVFSSMIGKYINFFTPNLPPDTSYSSFMITIAYCFVAVANVFLFSFTEMIFYDNSKTKKYGIASVNGILIGLILSTTGTTESAYLEILPYLFFFILVASFIYLRLFWVSIREYRLSSDSLTKTGFLFLSGFGLFLMLVFVFFIIDLIKISITGDSYNIEYYLAWSSAVLALACGYIGTIMPDWVKKLVGES